MMVLVSVHLSVSALVLSITPIAVSGSSFPGDVFTPAARAVPATSIILGESAGSFDMIDGA